jgi:hypothetical protein
LSQLSKSLRSAGKVILTYVDYEDRGGPSADDDNNLSREMPQPDVRFPDATHAGRARGRSDRVTSGSRRRPPPE